MGWWTRLKRIIRFYYLRIIRLRTSAHSIALGIALGVFIGCLPIIPFQSVVVLALAFIFRANKVAAFVCTFFSNALTMIPFYAVLYLIGSFVLQIFGVSVAEDMRTFDQLVAKFSQMFNPDDMSMRDLIRGSWELFLVLMTGGVILGVPWSIGMYFLGRKTVLGYRRRRAQRMMRRRLG
ncbi:MAG: DUF2062 domain-containing protein [Desulfovibrio sp.]|nr:MAG: DUF2062 domain-containing protein [Desulfovibrio sp.]